jgi:hypothetical protein
MTGQENDPLVGTWSISAGSWDISGGPVEYSIVEHSAIGQTGNGLARLNGDHVRIQMAHALFGSMVYDLQLDRSNKRMIGAIFGIPVVAERGPVDGDGLTSRTPAKCGACFGSGKRTCPSCGGRRTIWPVGASQPAQCVVCYATGKVRCEPCNGTGKT